MNEIRRSWASGVPSVGLWAGWVTPVEAERLGAIGYDWVLFDLEATGLGWDGLLGLTQACELGGSRVMVRVPPGDLAGIMRALDFGAVGVVVPMVSTPEQARAVAAATRYPPRGERANGQLRRAYPSHAEANEDVVCVAMIETAQGWANREAIAAVDGIDALMIGQVDLALSLGWPLDEDGGVNIARHPQATAAVRELAEVARRHGKALAAGAVGLPDPEIRDLLGAGVTLLGYGEGDQGAVARQRAAVRRWKTAGRPGGQGGDPR